MRGKYKQGVRKMSWERDAALTVTVEVRVALDACRATAVTATTRRSRANTVTSRVIMVS